MFARLRRLIYDTNLRRNILNASSSATQPQIEELQVARLGTEELDWPIARDQLMGDLEQIDCVITCVFDFLDSKSIAKLCLVNSVFMKLASSPRIWVLRLAKEFGVFGQYQSEDGLKKQGLVLVDDLRSMIKRSISQRYITENAVHPKDQFAQSDEYRLEVKRMIKSEKHSRDAGKRCNCIHEMGSICIIPVLFMIFIILFGYHIVNHTGESIPTGVFVPLILIILFESALMIWVFILKFRGSLCLVSADYWMPQSNSIAAGILNLMISDDGTFNLHSAAHVLGVLSGFLASFILFVSKLNGSLAISYSTAISPFICAIILIGCLPTIPTFHTPDENIFFKLGVAFFVSIPSSLYWMTPLFFALKLDGVMNITAAEALIPFFIIDFAYLLMCIAAAPVGIFYFICVIGPVLAFEITLAARNWDSNPAIVLSSLFIPLYLAQATSVCFFGSLSFLLLAASRSLRSRRTSQRAFDHFTNRYFADFSLVEQSEFQESEMVEISNAEHEEEQKNQQNLGQFDPIELKIQQ